jgi:hypothetical protein
MREIDEAIVAVIGGRDGLRDPSNEHSSFAYASIPQCTLTTRCYRLRA